MTNRKSPPQPPADDDELFGGGLDGSDSDFLAELDRVLSEESSEPLLDQDERAKEDIFAAEAAGPDVAFDAAVGSPAENGWQEDTEDLTGAPPPQKQDDILDLVADSDGARSGDEAFVPDIEPAVEPSADDAADRARFLEELERASAQAAEMRDQLDWNADESGAAAPGASDESDWGAAGSGDFSAASDDSPTPGAAFPVSPGEADWDIGGNEAPSLAADRGDADKAASIPDGPSLAASDRDTAPAAGEPPSPWPKDRFELADDVYDIGPSHQAPAAPAVAAGLEAASGQPESAQSQAAAAAAHETAAPAASGSGSSMWAGIASLLAVIGIGAGGMSLWQSSELNDRMAQFNAASPVAATAGPAPAVADERLAELEQRLGLLESAPSVVAAAAGTEATGNPPIELLEQRLVEQIERLSGEIADLRQQADAVSPAPSEDVLQRLAQQLGTVTERLDDLDDRLRGSESELAALAKAAAKPAATAKSTAAPRRAGAKDGWSVNLLSFQTLEKAESEQKRLHADGLPEVEIRTVDTKGKTWHRLVVSGFASVAEAKVYAQEVRQRPELSSAWIGRN